VANDSRPKVHIDFDGPGGNVYAIIGAVKKALMRVGRGGDAVQFEERALSSAIYDDVIQTAKEYVEFV
jgi:hypothetical protein